MGGGLFELIKAPKGMKDILPAHEAAWRFVESEARDVAQLCGCHEIRTPVLEYTELFDRGVGSGTDIVDKEMYTFEDRAGRSLTLRPEGTAGVARAFIESGLAAGPQPVKLYYFAPLFRYERPQSGRLREHHQFGVEVFGAVDAVADAEVIWMAHEVLLRVGLTKTRLMVNSIGCERCRPAYVDALRAYLRKHKSELCSTCGERIENNVLRVLDCKCAQCQDVIENAPGISDYLCDDCQLHIAALKRYLEALDMAYTVEPRLVRGLDYYTRTVFEFTAGDGLGTVCGGGRYNHLVQQLGGPDLPAVGFGMGVERVLLAMSLAGVHAPPPERLDLFVAVHGGMEERVAALKLARRARGLGMTVDVNVVERSLKAQFKYAGKVHARYVAVIGEREVGNGTVVLKNMETGEEVVARRDGALDLVR